MSQTAAILRLLIPRRGSHSLAGVIFIAFIGMGLITAALGTYGLWVLSAAGHFVADTYDGSLMAVSYARAASLDFSRMEFESLRRATLPASERAAITVNLDRMATTFGEDLGIADERALGSDERGTIRQIRALAQRWAELRDAGDAAQNERDAVAGKIIDRLDMLVELTADHSFVARHQAVSRMQLFTYSSFGAIVLALLLSAGITLLLTRRIMGPLAAAASVADRIAGGELDTRIPAGGEDETGALLRSMTVMQDSIRVMVEREQAQRLSAQNRLAEALENSREAIALVDAEGCIVIANSQLASFFPIIAPQLHAGMNFGEAFRHLPQLVEAERGSLDLLAPGSELHLLDGRWLRVSRSATEDGGFFLILSDINDIKEREARLEEARREAEAASEAKSAFFATITHELRTPLNAIIGFSEVLAGQMFGPLGNPKYLDYAQNIVDSGRHLLGIINNVLDLARHQAGRLELNLQTVDLGDILERAVAELRGDCERAALTLTASIAADCPSVHGDAGRLQQIVRNLLSNAVKFTQPGGGVTLSAAAAEDGFVRVEIGDTGIGMSAEQVPTALAVFGQVDSRLARRYDGTGLGLPLAKSLVELHGGIFSIASTPGQGTKITLLLPRDPATAARATKRLALVA